MRKIIIAILSVLFILANTAFAKSNNRVLIVLTSHDKLGDTGKKTGFWLPELTHPYYEFLESGFIVDIASPKGGRAPLDNKSLQEKDPYNERYLKDETLMTKVESTIALAEINSQDYAAIVFAGGSGPMWDFANNKDIDRVSREIYENGGIVGAICHGTAALSDIKLSNGKYLIDGKRYAAFTKEEEAMIEQLDIIPFLLEERLSERGGKHIYGKPWQENVVVDGRLITGQNPASAKKAAKMIIKSLGN